MNKHTPGPWRFNKYGGIGAGETGLHPLILSSEWEAGYYAGGSPDVPPEEMLANAHLISAAPDLLEACKSTLEGLRRDSIEYDDVERMVTVLMTAIAKAEGGA